MEKKRIFEKTELEINEKEDIKKQKKIYNSFVVLKEYENKNYRYGRINFHHNNTFVETPSLIIQTKKCTIPNLTWDNFIKIFEQIKKGETETKNKETLILNFNFWDLYEMLDEKKYNNYLNYLKKEKEKKKI
jgi:hypothetical protein